MSRLDDRLLPVFAGQHWLVSRADVERAGGTVRAATHRVRTGTWERADRSVYRLAGAPRLWEASILALILSAGPPAVATHHTAAALHGIPGYGRGRPEVAIPRGTEHRREGVRMRSSTDLDRCDPVVIAGIPTTDFGRTILDLARTASDRRLLRAIEWGRRNERVDWPSLISTLARHARQGRPGIRRLRRVITANIDREEVTDSDFELLVLSLLAEHGLPTPVLHHQVWDGERFVAEVDLAYPQLRIAIELDGAIHLEAQVRERDLPRQNDLVLLGWTVLRFSWQRFVDHPDAVLAEIRAARRAAQAAA